MWKLFRLILVIALLFFIGSQVAGRVHIGLPGMLGGAPADGYASPHIYMTERGSGKIAYAKEAEAKAFPASLTKVMTVLVALEHIDDLSAAAPVDVETYQRMVAVNASMAGFYGRERVTYRDLLYGTMLPSGGEAANSLAVNIADSPDKFAVLMNEKAKATGMTGTHFVNPEGLHDPQQYTTAADMAKLLDHALDNRDFRAIFTRDQFQTTATADHPGGLLLRSTLLSSLAGAEQPGFEILGGKSGTTYEAGQCWATLAAIGDAEYITVVMGAPLGDISHPDFAQRQDTLALLHEAAAGWLK